MVSIVLGEPSNAFAVVGTLMTFSGIFLEMDGRS